eukprot:TRINITY_DN3168_c0_g1_i4.p2 TRINITY_DN3168_c0_g1~~TRINITY_DN3168_c0_g1_i4.p2  ORF type:complete len:133 (+),score=0.83 TRINITY_DN3168_c0_g1_i4:146-544(+)
MKVPKHASCQHVCLQKTGNGTVYTAHNSHKTAISDAPRSHAPTHGRTTTSKQKKRNYVQYRTRREREREGRKKHRLLIHQCSRPAPHGPRGAHAPEGHEAPGSACKDWKGRASDDPRGPRSRGTPRSCPPSP